MACLSCDQIGVCIRSCIAVTGGALVRRLTGSRTILSQWDSQPCSPLVTLDPSGPAQFTLVSYWPRHPIWHFHCWLVWWVLECPQISLWVSWLCCPVFACVLFLFNVIDYSGFLKSVFSMWTSNLASCSLACTLYSIEKRTSVCKSRGCHQGSFLCRLLKASDSCCGCVLYCSIPWKCKYCNV